MASPAHRTAVRYAMAILAVAVVLLVKCAVPALSDPPLPLFLGAVLFSAWFGGVGPGLFATLLALAAADFFFIQPLYSISLDRWGADAALLQFEAEAVFISLLTGMRHRYLHLLHRRVKELRVTLRSIADAVVTTDAQLRVDFVNPVAAALNGWTTAEAADRPLAEVVRLIDEETRRPLPPPDLAALRDGKPAALPSRTLLVARDGTEWLVEGSAAPIPGPGGRPHGLVMVLRDVTESRQAEARLRAAHRQTAAILDSITDAFYTLDRDWRFTYVNARAREYIGRPAGELLGGVLWEIFPHVRGTVFEEEFRKAAAQRTVARFEAQSPVTGRWVEVRAYPSGAGLSVYFHDVTERKQAEELLRARLLSRLATIQEDERRRLARELHDETGQQLAALILGLKALRERPEAASELAADLAALQEQAEQIGEAAHTLAWELRPTALDDLGLEKALRDSVERWSARARVPVDFHYALGPGRLPPDVETHLYRIVREALTNVLRHAQATRVSVILERRRGQVLAIVEDDGRGFDAQAVWEAASAEHKLGLHGMRERVALMGGSLEVESSPGIGTTVFVLVPVEGRAEAVS